MNEMNHSLKVVFPVRPEEPTGRLSQQPMIYVKEKLSWQYHQLERNLKKEAAPTEDELNALGAEGWELVGVLSSGSVARFYFKRLVG